MSIDQLTPDRQQIALEARAKIQACIAGQAIESAGNTLRFAAQEAPLPRSTDQETAEER